MGGFPYWLMQLHPDIFLRHSDPNYMMHVEKWMGVLFNELEPLWNGNGGPIIMAQVENEYGNYRYCDKSYSKWLRDLFLQYIGDKAVLFTNDNARLNALNCGKIEGKLVRRKVIHRPLAEGNVKGISMDFLQRKKIEASHLIIVYCPFFLQSVKCKLFPCFSTCSHQYQTGGSEVFSVNVF